MMIPYTSTNLTKLNIPNIQETLLKEGSIREAPPTVHQFGKGVYIREITMPTDSIILGAVHTTKHYNIISKGSCILLDEEGSSTYIEAPCTFESQTGVQKLLYIVDECVWSTIHVTEETDVSKLEDELFVDFKLITNKRKEFTKCQDLLQEQP